MSPHGDMTTKTRTGLDATFRYLEPPEMPMHVGLLKLCELPAGFKGSFHKAVKNHPGAGAHDGSQAAQRAD